MPDKGLPQDQLIEYVYEKIDRARAVWRAVNVLDGCLRALIFLLAAVLVGFMVDNLFALPGIVRLVYGIGLLAGLLYMCTRYIVLPALRPLTDEMVATHIERAYPDLDNHLINAVLFQQGTAKNPLTRVMVSSQLNETFRDMKERDMARSTDRRALWLWGKWSIVLLAVVGCYFGVFHKHFANAFLRYAQPLKYIPPITNTRLAVVPGDAECLQGDSLAVEAHTEGVLPEKAFIYFRDEETGTTRKLMPFEGSYFIFEFASLQSSFHYWVEAGDAVSRRFTVTVNSRPSVREVQVTYTYPEYTGLGEKTESTPSGNISALVGSTARLRIMADRPLREGRIEVKYLVPAQKEGEPDTVSIPLSSLSGDTLSGEMLLTRSGQYRIFVTDESGVGNVPRLRQIVAHPDEPPAVRFIEPGKSVAVPPGSSVTLLAEASDNFALRGMQLFLQRRAGEDFETFRQWPYEAGTRQCKEGCVLNLKEMALDIGDTLVYYMQASDGLARKDQSAGRSRSHQITIVAAAAVEKEQNNQLEALRQIVRQLIKLQKANLAATQQVAGLQWDKDEEQTQRFRARARQLVAAEENIYGAARDAVASHAGGSESALVEMLGRIAAGEISRAVNELQQVRGAIAASASAQAAQKAGDTEQEIVDLLERLLQNPEALLAERLEKEGRKEDLDESLEDFASAREKAEKMLEALKSFEQEQKKVIEMSNRLKEVPVEDFTEKEEKVLSDVIDIEKKWAKYFQEAATDLSKLPAQDFSLANMAEEHLEVYSEVQRAAEAAERKAIEMAVPLEQCGLELAEEITSNLEKWLAEARDSESWKMENPIEDYDVPLAQLPEQLEDLIGDLLEEEEDMTEDIEDVTSGWLDSIDKGAGWDAVDGPISSMSAKGVTGNRLPNKQEVGGRSGEGRTAKSSGQFVEKTATGKGGRRTPTRLTPDPFESGAVLDTSKEAPTGASGGGKLSGWGNEGLLGPPPPAVQDKLRRMASQQRQLIDRAKRLDFGLKKYRYPRGDLPKTVTMLEELQNDLDKRDIRAFARKHRIVLSNLRELKELVDKQKYDKLDRSRLLPKKVRDEIRAAMGENVPEQYRDMVNDYFRALSESGSAR